MGRVAFERLSLRWTSIKYQNLIVYRKNHLLGDVRKDVPPSEGNESVCAKMQIQ